MEEKVRQEQGLNMDRGPRMVMENGIKPGEMRREEDGKAVKKIKTGDIVLRSKPFAFVILATHRLELAHGLVMFNHLGYGYVLCLSSKQVCLLICQVCLSNC